MDKSIFITGPDPKLELVYSDVWLPGLYSRRVMVFELPSSSSHEKVIDVITRGLKALVQGTPELGADSIVLPNASPYDPKLPWRALVKAKGIELVIKDLSKDIPSYKELEAAKFPLSAFRDDLLMPIPGPIMPEPQPEAKFQLSFIEGGVLLSVCMYHRLTDGNGMNTISKALGELCKQASEQSGDLPPRAVDTDRSVFKKLNGGLTDLKDHPAYDIDDSGAFLPGAHHDEAPPETNGEEPPPPPEFRPHYYHLSHEKAQALKDYGSRDTPVSTHDAIAANIWRNLIQSRVKSGELKDMDQISTYTIPHDARKHIGLPKTFIGNCTYFIMAQEKVSEIIKEDSLPLLAAKIRAALNKVDREHVEGMFTIRQKHVYSLSWWPILKANDPEMVGFTSFYHSGLMGDNWGALGEVKHFTSTDLGAFGSMFQRAHFVGPKLPGGRGCDVHIGITKPEVEHFRADPVWKRFFELREVTVNGA
ncbi:Acyltransferase easC [Pseudocercospora fuligena]|uniref:Acyltransferase easC n=1 Tax=Pseudocercospora fuligena TaxID=685502 RepID=A0A8H6RCX3_9PEZI|nr:Acyltransferase easC [Pseudocercospora fuligena]